MLVLVKDCNSGRDDGGGAEGGFSAGYCIGCGNSINGGSRRCYGTGKWW